MASKRPRPVRKQVSRTPAWVPPAAMAGGLAVVVGIFLAYRWYTTPPAPTPLPPNAAQVVVDAITSLPTSELDAVGQGTASQPIVKVSGTAATGPTGKPLVFYEGAEYCPYCAAERWPMIIALSRFGTFSGLATTSSSSTDVYPNTPTFTFQNASFTSQYIDFLSVETSDRNQNPLQTPTSAEQAMVNAYDRSNSIPFVDFGNRYAFSGATYIPDMLAGYSWQDVASALQNPSSPQAKAILGSANLITAAICKLTGDQPATVCSSATIQALEKKLG
ncbi:MAG: DUF929 family protein [Candidatus Dormibacterales bacterium]